MPSTSSACLKANLALAEAVVYLALAPKSNALYTAYSARARGRRADRARARPPAPAQRAYRPDEVIGYGKGYQYAHDLEGKVADMQCLPDNLRHRVYQHRPTTEGAENGFAERLKQIRERRGLAARERKENKESS